MTLAQLDYVAKSLDKYEPGTVVEVNDPSHHTNGCRGVISLNRIKSNRARNRVFISVTVLFSNGVEESYDSDSLKVIVDMDRFSMG